jgi:DNA-binding SARP family transcriptional activator
MARLSVRLFGPFQVILDAEEVVGFRSDKVRALLAYLCVEAQRPHRREKLAGLLWPEWPEQTARANLRHALANLRQAIGDRTSPDDQAATTPFLQTSRQAIQFDPTSDAWIDVTVFVNLVGRHPEHRSTVQPRGTELVQRLEQAVALYRGEFMEGFSIPDSPAFEEWVLLQRESLHRLVTEALHRLADAYGERGELEFALEHAWRQVELDPWREQAHRQVMRLLALSGQRGAALAQYETCRRLLAEELGVEPAQETTALYERIRDGDLQPPSIPATRPLDIEPQRPAFLDEAAETAIGPQEPFVGRVPELARLAGFLESTLAGRGRVVFVSGEAGWGKTRLLAEFSQRAQENHSDLIVASGTCTTFTGMGDPYLPFREILRMLCADVEQEWAAGNITRPHAFRLWRLLPSIVGALAAHGPHLIETFVPGEALLERAAAHPSVDRTLLQRVQELTVGGQESGIDQGHIFEEVAGVLKALAKECPLLLILDDLHWADTSSIGLLFHLGRRLVEGPILILGTYRPEDISLGREGREHPLVRVLDEFKRLLGDVWVHLGEDGHRGRGFVDALLDSKPNRLGRGFRDQLAQSTRGHPLFTVEILRDMEERGHIHQDERGRLVASRAITWDALPQRVEGVIERRIHRLDPRLRDVLATASVEGEEFTAEVIARVRKMSEVEMVGLLSGDLAKTHHLVRASGIRRSAERRISRYRFSHHLFQKFLYHTLDPVERAYLHEAVGEALETLHEGHTEEIAIGLARHFQEAGRLGKAVAYLRQAGDAAAGAHANTEAIGHYLQAIDLAEEIGLDPQELALLYTRLGRSLELNSQFEQALVVYEDMEDVAHRYGDRPMELASLMARVTVLAVPTAVHDPARAQSLGAGALVLARELGDPAAQAKILWNLSLAHYLGHELAPAIQSGERSLALAREHNLREQTAQTLNDLGSFIYMYSGRLDQAKEALHEASDLWRELGNLPMLADSLASSATAHVFGGDFDQAVAFSEQAFQISHSIGNPWGQSYSQWKVGLAYWERGDLGKAIATMQESIRLAELAAFLPPQANTRAELAALYGEVGAVERGLELARLALHIAEAQNPAHVGHALGMLARLQLLDGNVAEAQDTIGKAKNDSYGPSWPVVFCVVALAEAELALRREEFDEALEVTTALLAELRQYGMRLHMAHSLYLHAEALRGENQDEAARNRLLEARAEAEAMGSRWMLWRILHALSQLEVSSIQAELLRQQAQEIVEHIAEHIQEAALRASFLNLPEVRAVLEAA